MKRRSFTLLCGTLLLAPGAAWAGATPRKKGGGESFIQFATLTASVFRPDGTRGVLTVEAGLDIPDPALRARADESRPLLRDAFVQWLTIYGAGLTGGAAPDPDQIAFQLQRATDRVLGRPGARLLLGTVLVN